SETQALKEGDTPYLSEYDDVINMQRVRRTRTVGFGDAKRTEVYFEGVYNIKRVSYWYNVPATCKSCGEAVVLERKGRDPAETADTATHIHVENMSVDNVETVQIQQPDPLPPIFCPFCNGKNKGEATKCEHCGGKI
ncbi:MAG: hypothetical protein LBL66_10415, partial [Clostridiales bacterium]|nr:hypothetical protein [Clostridiales bacterium]